MTIEWNIILWCCITLVVIMAVVMGGYYFMTARMMKKRRGEILNIHENIKVGRKIMFAGIIGKIVRVKDDFIDVEIAKDTVVSISRYAITDIVE